MVLKHFQERIRKKKYKFALKIGYKFQIWDLVGFNPLVYFIKCKCAMNANKGRKNALFFLISFKFPKILKYKDFFLILIQNLVFFLLELII